ncbi:MAG: DNA-directed RNA polymerase subunit beta', partial [Bacilli bacterium]|nr:DNA-directed RNA polymerase subunit beta' [Bacilli bacterium]
DFLTYSDFIAKYTGAEFGIGAEAIERLLKEVDIQKEFDNIQAELKENQGQRNQKRLKLLKRLEVVDAFRQSDNKPEWMILEALPVIPPDIRPMLPLDGGRFATSDLNDLYRRVITRNIRLKRLLEIKAPSIILMNEKRMLQEAVDALIDNGRRGKAVTGISGRQLKSLSHTLKGKQGRFRQNLLGKRVDFSGRSVIAVGPSLKLYQCGVPREMAVQLFKPFITAEMIKEGIANNQKVVDQLIEAGDDCVMRIVEDLVKDHPVLLNRAPTLHRLGIQAFEVKLVEGRAIRLHPLVCTAFNADFDGDQMAIHVPLSEDAIQEARQLMLGSKNILGPKDGKPIMTPSQDILLGNYYLTTEYTKDDFRKQAAKYLKTNNKEKYDEFINYAKTEGKVYNDMNELEIALANHDIHLHSRVAMRVEGLHKTCKGFEKHNGSYLVASVGRFIFNKIFPAYFPFLITTSPANFEETPNEFFLKPGTDIKQAIADMKINPPFKKKDLSIIINESFARCGKEDTAVMLDDLKDQGYFYSTVSAVTVSLADIIVYDKKKEIIAEASQEVDKLNNMFDKGLLTNEERHKLVCDTWTALTNEKGQMSQGITAQLQADPSNPIFIMSDSGARGNASNFMQLSGMRGIMENPSGDQIEIPIKSSFREGLTVSEYFISSHGARKGGADTALKTAESGYLTRRLVDVAHDVVVRDDDCGTDHGTIVSDLLDDKADSDKKPIEKFEDRILGRYPLHDVVDPATKEVICTTDQIIDEAKARAIVAAGYKQLEIRTIFGCETKDGVCAKCYGRNLATGLPVVKGEAVGIMAAQSIGEPGTQLTMKNFHTGGVAGGEDITQGLPRVQELFEARNPKGEAIISEIVGKVSEITEDKESGRSTIVIKNDKETKEYVTPFDARLRVKEGDDVINGQKITEGAINPKHLLEVSDAATVQNYILREVLKVYGANGIGIADKHIEIMIHQMFKKLLITDAGDTALIPGTKVTVANFTEVNTQALLAGKRPAVARPMILGVTKASLETESFLSSASFQETTKVLTDAATKGKIDYLHGLKENVLVGKLIPAGTTINPLHYKSKFTVEENNVATTVAPGNSNPA